jgi:hypothetical protein
LDITHDHIRVASLDPQSNRRIRVIGIREHDRITSPIEVSSDRRRRENVRYPEPGLKRTNRSLQRIRDLDHKAHSAVCGKVGQERRMVERQCFCDQ